MTGSFRQERPGCRRQGHVAEQGGAGLEDHQPLKLDGVVEQMPGAGRHGAHQGRQHGQGEPAPLGFAAALTPVDHGRHGQDPLQDRGHMDPPGGQ